MLGVGTGVWGLCVLGGSLAGRVPAVFLLGVQRLPSDPHHLLLPLPRPLQGRLLRSFARRSRGGLRGGSHPLRLLLLVLHHGIEELLGRGGLGGQGLGVGLQVPLQFPVSNNQHVAILPKLVHELVVLLDGQVAVLAGVVEALDQLQAHDVAIIIAVDLVEALTGGVESPLDPLSSFPLANAS